MFALLTFLSDLISARRGGAKSSNVLILRQFSVVLVRDYQCVKLSDDGRVCRNVNEAVAAVGGSVGRHLVGRTPLSGTRICPPGRCVGEASGRSEWPVQEVCIPLTPLPKPKRTPQSTSTRCCWLCHYRRARLSLKRHHIKTASWTCLAGNTTPLMKYTSIKQSLMAGCHRCWPSDRKAFSGWISAWSTQKFSNINGSFLKCTYGGSHRTSFQDFVFFIIKWK